MTPDFDWCTGIWGHGMGHCRFRYETVCHDRLKHGFVRLITEPDPMVKIKKCLTN